MTVAILLLYFTIICADRASKEWTLEKKKQHYVLNDKINIFYDSRFANIMVFFLFSYFVLCTMYMHVK